MGADDAQSQAGYDDPGMGGPGAPTPLTALEVARMGRVLHSLCLQSFREYLASLLETSSLS